MTGTDLEYGEIQYRLQNHVVFRIFRKDRAALIIAFLLEAFKKRHRSDIPQGDLVAELASFLVWVKMETSAEEPAQNPQRLLDEWSDDGILRKYYVPGSDEARYDLTPEVELVMERPLFVPQEPAVIAHQPTEIGRPASDSSALFDLDAVDLEQLAARIRALLRDRPQVTLGEVIGAHPVTGGLAELLGYFTLATRRPSNMTEGPTMQVAVRSERTGRTFRVTTPDLVFLPELSL